MTECLFAALSLYYAYLSFIYNPYLTVVADRIVCFQKDWIIHTASDRPVSVMYQNVIL